MDKPFGAGRSFSFDSGHAGPFGVPPSLRYAAGPARQEDGDEGSGSNGGDESSTAQGAGGGETEVADHLDADRLVAEHGNARQALGAVTQKLDSVEADNADLREERNQLRDQVPGDEDVVIPQEEVNRLQEEGLLDTDTPSAEDVVSAMMQEREKRRTLENQQTFREVVSVTGANEGVLKDLGADTLDYEMEEVEDGKVQVFVETDDGRTPFTDYFQNNYPNLADTILPDGEDSGEATSSDSESSTEEGGGEESATTFVPPQPSGSGEESSSGSGGSGGSTPSVDEFIERENKERGYSTDEE